MLIYNKIHSLIIIEVLEKILIHTKWTGSVISNIGKPSHAMQARDVNYSQNFSILSRILLQAIFFFFSLQLTDEKETVFQVHNYFFPREREREKKKKRERTGETGRRGVNDPGKSFKQSRARARAAISSVCRAPYVWFHSQL